MWVKCTPEEIAKREKDAEKQAKSDGLVIGLGAWLFVVLLLSAGWIVSLSGGFAVKTQWGGTFWTRLPIFAVLASPIIFIARRFESRKALRKSQIRTVCPQCDIVSEGNADTACQCGGTYVPSSTMKWIE